jgi:kinesin family protein 15
MHEALQMAMAGHARILDQYAELQEKHLLLLANMRDIRHGVIEHKREAIESGLNAVEEQWFDSQATQITYLKVEQERSKEQIKGLQAQLDDTADAVQAAGELLVRLKESEQAAVLAKVDGYSIPRLASVAILT